MENPKVSSVNWFKRLNKPLASLKLAVFIILAIAVITAAGTIVESLYDAYAAKKWVYDTWYMYAVMALLVVNLIAVMLDRWPWKKRHAAFVLAHMGIILILFGALLTMRFGLDGSMRVAIGESNNLVQAPETEVVVYSSFDGDRYSKTFEKEVDFFVNSPNSDRPLKIPTYGGEIQIVEYKKYVLPSRKVVASTEAKAGSAIRFQIQNSNVDVIEWLVQKKPQTLATHNFGPAQIHLGPAPLVGKGLNEIYLTPENDRLHYVVFQKDSSRPLKKGFVAEGQSFDPGFKMGMQFRVLRFLPKAMEDWELQTLERPTPMTTSAIKILFNGKENWVLLNDMVKLFTDNAVYLLSYGNRRVELDFPLKLKSFEVSHYQGTMRAMAYQSVVEVPGLPDQTISMNEPLKHKKLTFYQASFQDENGRPVASIFSVNYDPGRFFKYLGSLVMSLGIILLMWFKHLDFRFSRKKDVRE